MKNSGFTLIEILVTVAIVAILASVAWPSYTSYMQRSRITEATNALSTLRVQLEQYYQDNKDYGSTAAACGNNIGTASGQAFDLSCNWGATGDNQHYTVTARGKGIVNGFIYTIDQDNNRTTTFPGRSAQNCWLLKPGELC